MRSRLNLTESSIAKIHRLIELFSLAATGLILFWILRYSFYGFDFTDESFYLVWIANPFIYDYSSTQFGFIYHPIYVLLGGDIAALRQFNILGTFLLAWGAAYTFLSSLAPEAKERRASLHIVAAGFATSALFIFNTWLPTPSYNSLALQALLIAGIGLLMADKAVNRRSVTGWIIIGAGGWLAFMAKPSTAFALAMGVLIYILIARKFSPKLLLLAIGSAAALLLLSAILIDGSITGFILRLERGVEFVQIMGGANSPEKIFRLDHFELNDKSKQSIYIVLIATTVAVLAGLSEKWKGATVSMLVSASIFSLIVLSVLGDIKIDGLGSFQGLLIFGVVFAAGIIGILFERTKLIPSISLSQWAMALLFLVMPHIFAFGTGNNYWQAGGGAAIFWLFAGLTLMRPVARAKATWSVALPLVLATQLIMVATLQGGFDQPYRQPQPLKINNARLEIGPRHSALVLQQGYAAYIAEATAAAQEAGLKPGTPVIDLSGQSPGILYALGAENIGQAWTIGGYPGSLKLAIEALALVPCEKLSLAWLLYEPAGPRSIPEGVLPSFGADASDYKIVASWETAVGAGGYEERRLQQLLMPVRSADVLGQACNRVRMASH